MQQTLPFNVSWRATRVAMGALLFLATGWNPAQTVLTNESVVKMVKSGLSEGLVVNVIENQPGAYSLNPEELATLKAAGVSEKILAAMVSKGATIAGSATTAGSVRLRLKTPVRLVLDEAVSSKTAKSGDTFKLAAGDDVLVDGRIVIAKGAPATGRITGMKKKSFATHNGSIEIAVDSVRAVDGRAVALEARVASGGEGAAFGHFGKDAELPMGYVVNAVVASETEIALPKPM